MSGRSVPLSQAASLPTHAALCHRPSPLATNPQGGALGNRVGSLTATAQMKPWIEGVPPSGPGGPPGRGQTKEHRGGGLEPQPPAGVEPPTPFAGPPDQQASMP